MFRNRTPAPKAPQCTCRNAGKCGYCPSIAISATRQGQISARDAGSAAGLAAADRIAGRRR